MTIKEIKEMSNAQLIEKLCQCAESESNKAFNNEAEAREQFELLGFLL